MKRVKNIAPKGESCSKRHVTDLGTYRFYTTLNILKNECSNKTQFKKLSVADASKQPGK